MGGCLSVSTFAPSLQHELLGVSDHSALRYRHERRSATSCRVRVGGPRVFSAPQTPVKHGDAEAEGARARTD